MKTYNISRIPDGFSQPTYEEILLSGYTQGYEDGYRDGTEECVLYSTYFTVEAKADGRISIPKNITYCRINGGEWISSPKPGKSFSITVSNGDKVEMKNVYIPGTSDTMDYLFSTSFLNLESYIVYGNIFSLIYGDDFADKEEFPSPIPNHFMANLFANQSGLTDASKLILPAKNTAASFTYVNMFEECTSLLKAPAVLPATTLTEGCYENMFLGCTSLITVPTLPATTLAEGCYDGMFRDCTSLTTAPELPATTLAYTCYNSMFYGCTSLTTAPELPATILAERCYGYMFNGCTSLTTAPELPATTLATICYVQMFEGCTSLATAPELPATTLADYCYQYMFRGCTSLTTAPVLPATTLTDRCYHEMFSGCTSLNHIKCVATDLSAFNCTLNWVYGVAANGTFTKASSATWETGVSGIPEGWTVQDA